VSFVQEVSVKCRAECRGDQVMCVGNEGEDKSTTFDEDQMECQSTLNQTLLKAARDGDLEMLQLMLSEGAYTETRRPFVISPSADHMNDCVAESRGMGMTPVRYAALGGFIPACDTLLAQKACVNAEDEDGTRPLHFAASAGSVEICQLLLQHGADVAACDDDGHGALQHVPPSEIATPAAKKTWTVVLEPVPPHADASVSKVESADVDNVQHPPCAEAMQPETPDAGPEK